MKIERVHLNNYGSFYGEHEFRVSDRGLVFVAGDNQDEPKMDSNGSGKSTLFDALDWALFGKIPKGDHADSIVNEEAGKDTWVSVSVFDEEANEVGIIQRSRKPNKLSFTKGPPNGVLEDLTAMDTDATQAKIENFLGLDRKVFHAAVYRAQGDEFDFANAKDSEKKELLTRIIPELQEIDQLKDRTKKKVSDLEQQLTTKRAEVQHWETHRDAASTIDWHAREQEWLGQQASRIKSTMDDVSSIKADIAGFKKTLEQEGDIQTKLATLQNNPPTELEYEDKQKLEKHEQTMHVSYGQLTAAQTDAQHANQRRQSMNQVGEGKCSRCGQNVSGEHLEKEKAELTQAHQEKEGVRKTLETQYQQLGETRTFLKSRADAEEQRNLAKLSSHQQEIGRLHGMIQNFQNIKQALYKAEAELEKREQTLASLRSEEWPGAQDKAKADAQKQEAQAKIIKAQEEVGALEQKHALLSFWSKAFGLKGLKSFVLDARLQDMSDAANEWVKILTGGTHWVRFESQTMTRSGKLSEAVNVRVFKHNPDGTISDRNYKSYSGGEKKRISLGIDWGLSCLVASRASKKWDLYVIDESFRQHIDSGGRESIFELLEHLQKDRSSIYVIDHDVEMRSHFESSVTIRRKGQRSQIIEEDACQAAA